MTASTVTVTESRESTFILLSLFHLHRHCRDQGHHDQHCNHRQDDDDEQPPGVERQRTPSSGQPSCKSPCTGSQRRFLQNYDHDDNYDEDSDDYHDDNYDDIDKENKPQRYVPARQGKILEILVLKRLRSPGQVPQLP